MLERFAAVKFWNLLGASTSQGQERLRTKVEVLMTLESQLMSDQGFKSPIKPKIRVETTSFNKNKNCKPGKFDRENEHNYE